MIVSARGKLILRALASWPDSSIQDLTGELGLPYNSVRLELNQLAGYLEVTASNPKRFRLTFDGEQIIA